MPGLRKNSTSTRHQTGPPTAGANHTPRPAPTTPRWRRRRLVNRERRAPDPWPRSAGAQSEATDTTYGPGQGSRTTLSPPPGADAPAAPRKHGSRWARNILLARPITGASRPGHGPARIPRPRRAPGLDWPRNRPVSKHRTRPAWPAPEGPPLPGGRPPGDPRQAQARGADAPRSPDGAARRPTTAGATGGVQDPRGEERASRAQDSRRTTLLTTRLRSQGMLRPCPSPQPPPDPRQHPRLPADFAHSIGGSTTPRTYASPCSPPSQRIN